MEEGRIYYRLARVSKIYTLNRNSLIMSVIRTIVCKLDSNVPYQQQLEEMNMQGPLRITHNTNSMEWTKSWNLMQNRNLSWKILFWTVLKNIMTNKGWSWETTNLFQQVFEWFESTDLILEWQLCMTGMKYSSIQNYWGSMFWLWRWTIVNGKNTRLYLFHGWIDSTFK